jgi:hypothetical protein
MENKTRCPLGEKNRWDPDIPEECRLCIVAAKNLRNVFTLKIPNKLGETADDRGPILELPYSDTILPDLKGRSIRKGHEEPSRITIDPTDERTDDEAGDSWLATCWTFDCLNG